MSASRFIYFTSRNRCSQTLNLFNRFDPSRRFHSSSYMRSAKKITVRPPLPQKAPSSHSWRRYIIPTALLGSIGGVVFLFLYNDERRAVLKGQGADCDRCRIKGPIIGGPFTLVDTEGRLVTQSDFLGNWFLLYFGYTSSPDVGPAEVHKMAQATDILESKQNTKVLPVFVTVDPQRDNPLQLRAYLKEFDPRILGLTGPANAVRQMAQEYRVFFKKVQEDGDDYLVETSHNMYLLNPNMEVVRCFGVEYNAEELSEAILKEVNRTGTQQPQLQ